MRFLYNLLVCLVAPLAFLVELLRNLGDPDFRGRRGERLGFARRLPSGAAWIHAVSVGEVQAAAPLVRELLKRHPGQLLVMTTATPTGQRQARRLFGETVTLRYIPFDLGSAVRRFLDRLQPRVGIILETELWPNLLSECSRRGIPLVFASARISPRSARRYGWFAGLFRKVLSGKVFIAAQATDDAERFQSLGAQPGRTRVTGNIKFDFRLDPGLAAAGKAWRAANAPDRPVWVAGSTHEGEEAILLDAQRLLQKNVPDALLVIVPRHPGRFAGVARLLTQRGVSCTRRSSGEPAGAGTEVLLGDTMGELMLFYAGADVAFVGGSLVPVGGHNLLEPAALGLPILTGPYQFNGEEIYRQLGDAGAVRTVSDAAALAEVLGRLLQDATARRATGERALEVIAGNRGALGRLLEMIESVTWPADRRDDPKRAGGPGRY